MKSDDRFRAGIFVGVILICSLGYLWLNSEILVVTGLGLGTGALLKIYFDEGVKK